MGVFTFQLGQRSETASLSVDLFLEVTKLIEKLRLLVLGLQEGSGCVAYSECAIYVHSGIVLVHEALSEFICQRT